MPIKFSHFDPDHAGIRGFLHSDQLRDAVRKAGEDVIDYARPESKTLAPDWKVERGPDTMIGAYSRLTEQVVNENPAAAAFEFGSGYGRPGQSGTRPQGGASFPKRILGRAGAKVGDHRAREGL
jgi:hypothetical protein